MEQAHKDLFIRRFYEVYSVDIEALKIAREYFERLFFNESESQAFNELVSAAKNFQEDKIIVNNFIQGARQYLGDWPSKTQPDEAFLYEDIWWTTQDIIDTVETSEDLQFASSELFNSNCINGVISKSQTSLRDKVREMNEHLDKLLRIWNKVLNDKKTLEFLKNDKKGAEEVTNEILEDLNGDPLLNPVVDLHRTPFKNWELATLEDGIFFNLKIRHWSMKEDFPGCGGENGDE